MADDNIQHAMHLELQAAAVLRDHLKAIAGDDEQLLADMMEGETELRPLIVRLAESLVVDDAQVAASKAAAARVADRAIRVEKRMEEKRAAIFSAMQIAGLRKFETPVGTLSIKTVPSKVVVTDESLIPSAYFEKQDPTLSKKLLAAAFKKRKDFMEELAKLPEEARAAALELFEKEFPPIKGAEMSNGGETLAIRV